jgi:hypothetical protein
MNPNLSEVLDTESKSGRVYHTSPVFILCNVKSVEFSVIEDWSRDWSAGNKTTRKMEMHFVLQI